jgi:hypothetical protein
VSSSTRGRAMRPNKDDRPAPPVPPPPVTPPPDPGGNASPFAQYGPGAGSMGEMAEENRSQSLGILAIVGGLSFSVAAAVIMAVLVLLLWLLYSAATGDSPLAGDKAGKDQHVRDTGHANPQLPAPGTGRRTGNGGVAGGDPTVRDPSLGPPPGPASVIVPKEMMFLSIEVNCPGGYRNRGDFRKEGKSSKKATVQNVPGDERCTVTFQGSEPAKTWITGNQTLSCTFNPVVCNQVF